jgi:hypothetical protein
VHDVAPRRASHRHETCAGAVKGWGDTYSITYANLLILLGSIRSALQVALLDINELTTAINAEHYRFDITGVQQLQILRYSPLQSSGGIGIRLLERPQADAVVNLSAPTEYLGGGLQVKADIDNVRFIREQGAGCWFPSYIEHRARAPIWGTRWVLVAWLTGPAWR